MKTELIVEKRPKSSLAEAMRIIRTNLQFSSADKKVQTILITSYVPGEGKSFISINLATAFAQNGSKVLVIDCDLRKGRLHRVFNISNDIGLSNLLLESDMEKNYDYIIFDGTPVGGLTDSVVMAKLVDKVAIVCSVNYTKLEQLENTKKSLVNVGADVAGVIVNKVPEEHNNNYYMNYYVED